MIDIALEQNNGIYDIAIDPNTGDFKLVDGFETALIMSLFCERRADQSEIETSELRRGWWGNETGPDGFEIGSKLWLLDQARKTQETLNKSNDYGSECLQWFIDDGYLKSIDIKSSYSPELNIDIKLNRDNSITESRSFELWENTNVI